MANRLSLMKNFFSKISLGVSLLLGGQAGAALAPHFDAKIYDMKDHSKQMFNYKSEFEINGSTKTYYNTITDLDGTVLVLEKTVMTLNGDTETLESFEQEQKQIGTKGNLKIRDGKAYFTFVKGDKTKEDDEKFTDDFAVTSSLVKLLQARWADVMKGDTLKVRLAVLDRQETVGFQFRKEKDKEINGAPGVVLKMKPSSVIISALVNPLYFGFSADGKFLLELEGRTSVKLKNGEKFDDFDGYTVYTHPQPVVVPVVTAPEEPAKPAKAVKAKSKKK